MTFKIIKVDTTGGYKYAHFEVRDEHGKIYGPAVNTKKEAEQVKEDWENYYRV